MADGILFTTVYPQTAPGARIDSKLGSKALREIAAKLDLLRQKLTLTTPPKEDLTALAQQASPQRFERADLAFQFLTEAPAFGDPQFWRDATDTDAALGEVWIHLNPLTTMVERELAITLAEISTITGRIERTVTRLNLDPKTRKETGPFDLADLERARLDEQAASSRDRAKEHRESADADAARSEAASKRELGARGLLDADPKQVLKTKPTFKLKDPSDV